MRVVCISDTHHTTKFPVVPDGNLLIHAGDATFRGTPREIYDFCTWYSALPHQHKILIAGNHDLGFENYHRDYLIREMPKNITYLEDSGIEIMGFKIWGAPWQPFFCDWAFNLQRGAPLAAKWALIPDDTQILITHGPPNGIRDQVVNFEKCGPPYLRVGCEELLKRVKELKHLKYHIFGHIHDQHGVSEIDGVTFVNASICDADYRQSNAPIVLGA